MYYMCVYSICIHMCPCESYPLIISERCRMRSHPLVAAGLQMKKKLAVH